MKVLDRLKMELSNQQYFSDYCKPGLTFWETVVSEVSFIG